MPSTNKSGAMTWESLKLHSMVARAGTKAPAHARMRNYKTVYAPSRGSGPMRSTLGTERLGFVGLPALGLGADGSEHTFLGRGRRDTCLGGGGARVRLFLAAALTVSMTDD